MKQGSQYFYLALLLAFGLLSSGCAGGWLANHVPWGQKKEPEVPGIKTADQRIAELKVLAEKAPEKPAAEQQRISEKLARQIEKEQDPLVREQIVSTLAVYPTPLAAKVLQAALNDPESNVRIMACKAWGTRGGQEAVEPLSSALNSDSNIDVKLAAARALGKIKDPAALPPLADLLAESDPAIQHRAIESMKTISGRDFGADVNAWRQFAKTGQSTDTQPTAKSWWRRFF
jgi:hypothetical protein